MTAHFSVCNLDTRYIWPTCVGVVSGAPAPDRCPWNVFVGTRSNDTAGGRLYGPRNMESANIAINCSYIRYTYTAVINQLREIMYISFTSVLFLGYFLYTATFYFYVCISIYRLTSHPSGIGPTMSPLSMKYNVGRIIFHTMITFLPCKQLCEGTLSYNNNNTYCKKFVY